MKTVGVSLMLACGLGLSLEAQTNSPGAPHNTNALAARVAPTIAARSLNSRTWVRIISQTNAAGQVSTVTNKAYTELASGLCYEKDGKLVDSVERIEIVADGASATQAQHSVHFAGNANTAGAVRVKSRDGKTFASRVYGLSYWDPVSGTNVLLAPLQDCRGMVVGSNRVVYADAFNGVKADLEYVFTKAGLEQNVIVREQLPTPESVGIGLASASTRLEVLTEFFSPPAPKTNKTQVVSGIPEDTLIDFGAMKIGMGNAFLCPGQEGEKAVKLGRVSKHWKRLSGRDFLFEEVPYRAISNAVKSLPVHASAAAVGSAVKHYAALEPLLPQEFAFNSTPMTMQLAESMPERPGVVLDYMEFDGPEELGSLVFQSDTTYYINGYLWVWGAVFEGGTVVKFESSYGYPFIQNTGDAPCQFNGSAYRPVVLTSSDDNSVGDTIADSSGNPMPTGAEYACYIGETIGGGDGTNVISHVRFSYSAVAYEGFNVASYVFTDCQFVQCGYAAIWIPDGSSVYLGNDLFTGCGTVLEGNNIALDAENITADSISCFCQGNCSGGITNSILTACDSSITNFNLDHTVVADSGSGIYQSVGDGNYYLNSSGLWNRGVGTTNINPWLLAELQTKTTWPPLVFADAWISGDTNLGITALRDTVAPGPDIGFHYDPLDWVFGETHVDGNLSFSSGVAVGWYCDTNYGIAMGNNRNAYFQGTATAPAWWVRCNTVQEEGGNTVWPGAAGGSGMIGQCTDVSQSPQANLFFAHCSILGGGDGGPMSHFADSNGCFIVNATHSEFYGGSLGGNAISVYFMNCLMDRVIGGQYFGCSGNGWMMTNCTWIGGSLTLRLWNTDTPLVVVRDSAFDGTVISIDNNAANPDYAYYDYNAFEYDFNGYDHTAYAFPIGGANNTFPEGFNWQSSVLGNFYLPSDSPLIASGDVTADQIGLDYFTTQPNQTPEGTAIVDIGYHYMVMNAPYTNCVSAPGGHLTSDDQYFCVGESAFGSATWTDVPGLVNEGYYDPNFNWVVRTNPAYPTILTNWSVVNWHGVKVTNWGSGTTSSYSFTPTNSGVGTNVFYFTYNNATPCDTGPHTISIRSTFAVLAVDSLLLRNAGSWIEVSNAVPGTRVFLMQPNPGLHYVYVTPIFTPEEILPSCCSLTCSPANYGVQGYNAHLNISAPAVYEVNCVCGTSAVRDVIFVTTNETLDTGLDYSNGLGTNNVISFQIGFSNQYVNLTNAPLSLGIQGGVPYYWAVTVDNTNFGGASWTPYTSSNIFANLGTNEGWHTVWVGLRGLATNAQQTWNAVSLDLDLTPPLLAIMNPAAGSTVSVPVIQVLGFCPEPLSSISYDLSNDAGFFTNQQVLVVDQFYDLNLWAFTTNFFQAFDVQLTNGLNTFTFHAADLAGNVTATNFSVTVDYLGKTNPPLVQVNWPLDGGIVCGSNFVCCGSVSDPTATVAVQIVDTNSYTNWLDAEVGRDGNFWAERVPLNGGANYLSLTVTDAAGNVTNISLTITQGDMGLSIDAVAAGQTNVTGEIDSSDCAIWVNGVEGVNNGDGTWAAQIAPIGANGGTVVAMAYPISEENFMGIRSFAMEDDNTNATQGQGVLLVVPAPSGVYISSYQKCDQEHYLYPSQPGTNTNQFLWQNGQGGMSMLGSLAGVLDVCHWPATSWPQPLPGGVVTQVDLNLGISNTWNIDAPTLPEEHYNISIANPYYGVQYLQRTADTQMKLATGGMPGSTHMNVWLISCSATNYSPPWGWGDAPIVSAPIDPRNIRIPSGQFDSNGNLYLVLPDNTNLDVTPFVTGPNSDYYTFNITATKYRLVHQCVAIDPPDRWRLTLGVGEQVNFYFDPALPTNVSWAGGSGGGFVPTNGAASTFTAASNQASAPVFFAPPPGTMQSPTEMRRQVTVFPPANIVASNTEAPWPGSRAPKNLETNKAGAATGFALLIEPTNVPFSVVEFMEVGSPPTEVTGFFANTNIYTTNAVAPAGLISIYHDASFWYRPFNAHNYGDSVWIRPISPPYSNGSFQWVITNQWKLNVQGAPTNFFLVTTQTFNLDSNGTVTITKFGNHGVTRQTNGFVTNW